ncbi:MAG: siderophore biosynthesis protein, partial [Actinomycetota bacterium]|nr:siderophore biosynthesis protein [Actinomycetota bacterium]
PRMGRADVAAAPLDAATVAALVSRELLARVGGTAHQVDDVVARVLDSAARIDRFAAAAPEAPPPGFLAGEQALVHGHPFHPAAKSREGLHEAEEADCFPELAGSLRLHWYAARADLVAHASAGTPATETLAALAGDLTVPEGYLPVPLHPWQARALSRRPRVQSLLADGALRDLGPAGPRWFPTSSLRTVWSPHAPCQLKLSLGLRITNSRRDNHRHELELGVRASRLLAAGLDEALRIHHPGFSVVRDHGWIDLDHGAPGETAPSGFAVGLRDNPFAADTPSVCMAGLVAPGADGRESMLAGLLRRQAAAAGEPVALAALAWLQRYLDHVVAPLLWLRCEHGIALEAHHQNILVDLDGSGRPVGGRYRDSQGWYAAASHHPALDRLVPGFAEGMLAVFDDALVDERLTYYLVVNNLLGLVGALGSQGVADEEVLLRAVREWMAALATAHPLTPTILTRLLDAPTLRCKANLLTSVDGRDELTGSVEQQSVYVDIPNPIAQVQS